MFGMSVERIIRGIKWLLYAVVIGVPLFYWKWSLDPYAVPKTALFETLVELIFTLWLILAISNKRYRPRMTPLAWAVAGYLALLTITALTGVDPWRSFFSDLERAFGIVMYYHLAALALVVSSLYREIPWKKLWYTSFGVALFSVGIALIQLKLPDFLLEGDSAGGRPGAMFGNPTFLAGYLLFNIFLAGYYLLSATGNGVGEKKAGEKTLLWSTVLAGIVGVFITATRGDILGMFGGISALVVLFAFRPPILSVRLFSKRSFYGLLIAILVIVAGGVWFTRTNAVWDRVPGIDRLKNLTLSGSNSDIAPRLMALDASWKGFVERPFTGWGFENFNVVFNKYYDPKVLEYGYAESDFDKPHDIVMEQLDAGGILLLLAYLAILVALVYEAWKLKDRLLGQVMLAVVIAYFIRSLVIFDTIGPVLMLYLLAGWIDGAWQSEQRPGGHGGGAEKAVSKGGNPPRVVPKGGIVAAALIGAVIVAYTLNGTAMAASSLAWQGHEDLQLANDPSSGLAAFRQDAATWNVYQWDFIRDYSNTVAQAYFYDESTIPQSEVTNAIGLMQQVALDHPNDAYNHYVLTDIFNLAYDIDPKDYLALAEQQAQLALALSPNRQEIYFYLSKTKSLEGDNAGALALSKTALDLDPNVADSHFYYGMLAFANGDNTTGYNEVETAITMGRKWTNYHEPEVAGDFFADSGHLSEAITFYQAALALDPTDYSAEAKLGAAYYLSNDDVSAKKYLSDAATHIDFNTSPAVAQFEPILKALGIQ
jgi:O-antigen ligase/tetratricopeptide (TPR) repeat protein